MFSILQISAIIGLLLAFGVPQKNIDVVQQVLQDAGTQSQVATTSSSISIGVTPTQQVPQIQPAPQIQFGATPVPQTAPTDCSPVLEAQLIQIDAGDLAFMGTTTEPSGCSFDLSSQSSLQMPGVLYHGAISDFIRNGQFVKVGDSYVYKSTWGTNRRDGLLIGDFTWTMGSSTITVSKDQ